VLKYFQRRKDELEQEFKDIKIKKEGMNKHLGIKRLVTHKEIQDEKD